MEYYLTREPVLDRGWNVAGYEVQMHTCDADDLRPSAAIHLYASDVLRECSDRLLGGKPALVDFNLISNVSDWTALLSPEKVVVEIANTVKPNGVLPSCRSLQEQGYAVTLETC